MLLVTSPVDRDAGAVVAGELGAGVAGRQLQFADLHGFAVERISKFAKTTFKTGNIFSTYT